MLDKEFMDKQRVLLSRHITILPRHFDRDRGVDDRDSRVVGQE
jgi:hypothetical protein